MKNLDGKKTLIAELLFKPFKIPPAGDALVVCRKSPLGKTVAGKMLEMVSPGEFEKFDIKNQKVESIFIRKNLLKNIDERKKLVKSILDEVEPIISENALISVKCEINLKVIREL